MRRFFPARASVFLAPGGARKTEAHIKEVPCCRRLKTTSQAAAHGLSERNTMPTLKIKYRTFDGFERAIAAQTAHFSALHPDVGFALSHAGPEEIYAEMVEHSGATDGRYDLMLTLTDWLPDLIRRKGLRAIDAYLASDPPEGWPGGWSDSVLGLQRDA